MGSLNNDSQMQMTMEQVHIAAKLAAMKADLKLKTHALFNMPARIRAAMSQASRVKQAAFNSRAREYEAQARTASLQNTARDLGEGVSRHEQDMELSEEMFASKED